MTLLLHKAKRSHEHLYSQMFRSSATCNLLHQQDPTMNARLRERWLESDVASLPPGEHDYFDRKSGDLLMQGSFRMKYGKALSAFSNSGGGHLILGVRDDGSFDGVAPTHKGRTSTREWLEQITPELLSYPLATFRVHEVLAESPSAIPDDRIIIVVDVGDSDLAPHQSATDHSYYCRAGGHSIPAPHFLLETLRNRLTRPALEVDLTALETRRVDIVSGGVFVEASLEFAVRNCGRVAAYKWALILDGLEGVPEGRDDDYILAVAEFPTHHPRDGGIRMDDTLLPSLGRKERRPLGVLLRPETHSAPHVMEEIHSMLSEECALRCRVVSETSPGDTKSFALGELFDFDNFNSSFIPLDRGAS